jgi:hypothetical protein
MSKRKDLEASVDFYINCASKPSLAILNGLTNARLVELYTRGDRHTDPSHTLQIRNAKFLIRTG